MVGLPLRREVALFVDFENLYYYLYNHISDRFAPLPVAVDVIKHVKDRIMERAGTAPIVMAAYADFQRGDLADADAMRSLALLGMHARYVLGTDHKNAADMQMSLDALEAMFRNDLLQTYVLLAGDRDYIPLVTKLREYGKDVFAVSFRRNTSGDLREIVGRDRMWDIDEILDIEYEGSGAPRGMAPMVLEEETESANGAIGDCKYKGEVARVADEETVIEAPDWVEQSRDEPKDEPTSVEVHASPLAVPSTLAIESTPRGDVAFREVNELRYADQEDVLECLLEKFSDRQEIWFNPAKKVIASTLVQYSDYDVNRILNELRDLGCFTIEKRKGDPYDYSVIILNYQHPAVIRFLP